MDTLEKPELAISIRHIARFLKSEIPMYNMEVPDTASRKTRTRRGRTEALAKGYGFHPKTLSVGHLLTFSS